jgi:hypothetical protein
VLEVSLRQFAQADLAQSVARVLRTRESGLEARYLDIELQVIISSQRR